MGLPADFLDRLEAAEKRDSARSSTNRSAGGATPVSVSREHRDRASSRGRRRADAASPAGGGGGGHHRHHRSRDSPERHGATAGSDIPTDAAAGAGERRHRSHAAAEPGTSKSRRKHTHQSSDAAPTLTSAAPASGSRHTPGGRRRQHHGGSKHHSSSQGSSHGRVASADEQRAAAGVAAMRAAAGEAGGGLGSAVAPAVAPDTLEPLPRSTAHRHRRRPPKAGGEESAARKRPTTLTLGSTLSPSSGSSPERGGVAGVAWNGDSEELELGADDGAEYNGQDVVQIASAVKFLKARREFLLVELREFGRSFVGVRGREPTAEEVARDSWPRQISRDLKGAAASLRTAQAKLAAAQEKDKTAKEAAAAAAAALRATTEKEREAAAAEPPPSSGPPSTSASSPASGPAGWSKARASINGVGAAGGDLRSEMVKALQGSHARGSLRRVSSTAADEIAAMRQGPGAENCGVLESTG